MCSRPQTLAHTGFNLSFNDGILGLVGAAILLFTAVVWTDRGPNVGRTDFSLTYVGARIVHDRMGRDLYHLNLQKQLRDSLFQHPVPLFFEHPPFEALLLSPLSAHSFRTAYLIWGLANATIWLLMIVLLRKYLPWPREDLGYVSLWLLFAPLWVALYQGQSSLFLLAFYALAFVLLKREKEFAAGIALGFGLLKFQFVLPFVLIFLVRRKWRFLLGFVVSSFVLTLLSIAAVGWRGAADYVQFLFTIGRNPQNISYGSGVDMPTIHGFVYALVGQRIGYIGLNIVVAFLSISLLAWVAWRWDSEQERSSFDLMFAAAVAASLLSGSHMFTHDFSPLILPMLLAAGCFSKSTTLTRIPSPLIAVRTALVLLWMFPVYFVCVNWHCLYLMGPVLFLFTWGAVQTKRFSELTEVAAK
jgi:alpha-1,2-mannosyltransferase